MSKCKEQSTREFLRIQFLESCYHVQINQYLVRKSVLGKRIICIYVSYDIDLFLNSLKYARKIILCKWVSQDKQNTLYFTLNHKVCD